MDDELFEHYEEREEQTRELAERAEEQQMAIDEEEENEDPARVCWANLRDDDRRCKILCGFSPEEFLTLYDVAEEGLLGYANQTRHWDEERCKPLRCK